MEVILTGKCTLCGGTGQVPTDWAPSWCMSRLTAKAAKVAKAQTPVGGAPAVSWWRCVRSAAEGSAGVTGW